MLSASDTQEFIPYGRQCLAAHPGKQQARVFTSNVIDHGLPLVKALKDIRLTDKPKESWKLWRNTDSNCCHEELYVCEQTVVWSRGNVDGNGQVLKTFTMDSPVLEVMWCTFLLPVDEGNDDTAQAGMITAQVESGICMVEETCISIFTTDGKDYITSLPFQISKTWPIRNGLLFERTVTPEIVDLSKTPNKKDQRRLPVLFSMLHPLDEVSSVICRTGGNTSLSKVSFVTETSQEIVFSSETPSLVMTYDRILSAHAVWAVRHSKPEEVYSVYGNNSTRAGSAAFQDGTTTISSHTASALSRLTLSSQSQSISPFRSYGSRMNSPSFISQSRLNSPSLSHSFLPHSRSESPLISGSLHRLHTPSPQAKASPGRFVRTPISANMSSAEQSISAEMMEALIPDICIDHLWTETGNVPRDRAAGKASKAFLTKDLCGQQYLCYVVPYRNHVRCVKFEESNDKSQLIFGSLSILQGKDAVPLPSLNMMALLDMTNSLILYSGMRKINKIHVGGLPSPSLSLSSSLQLHLKPVSPFGSPVRLSSGPVTSSRPPSAMDARFDDEVQLLSPVPTEFNDSSQLLDISLTEELSFQLGDSQGCISGLRDPVDHKFTLELRDGAMYRISLPKLTKLPIIQLCMEALRQILPKDTVLQVLIRWYDTHNAPGSVNGQSEWVQFARCIMGLMGYDVSRLHLTRQGDLDSSSFSMWAPKKARPSDQGSDEDWQYLLNSEHHQLTERSSGHLLGLSSTYDISTGSTPQTDGSIDNTALLFKHIRHIFFALHLVYEEMKLDEMFRDDLHLLAGLLIHLASDLRHDLYVDHYCRDFSDLFGTTQETSPLKEEELSKMKCPSSLTAGVSEKTKNVIAMFVVLLEPEDPKELSWSSYLRKVSAAGKSVIIELAYQIVATRHRSADFEDSLLSSFATFPASNFNPYERLVLFMAHQGPSFSSCLTYGISLPLKEAIFHCRDDPPRNWPEEAYMLIGREDLARQHRRPGGYDGRLFTDVASTTAMTNKWSKDEDDGMEYLDKELLKLRFSEDLRVNEVRRLLQSSRPVRISLTQRPEVSDHEFIQEQEKHLYMTCIRTMALPLGRGVFMMCTYRPVPTEALPIPKLCLTGCVPPRNTTVDLTHIDAPANMSRWPQFHNGVAAGLCIAHSLQVDSTWILYNRPRTSDLSYEHAGFLMGLGFNGHLSNLATLSIHRYLSRGHEMTSIALLLGIAAGKRGTMDVSTTRLLSIHVAALLPPTSTELEVPHNVQVAAILGVGLVYQGTAHTHIAEVLLNEIGRPPGPEMENCCDRESYSLAAGLALGLVMLGKDGEVQGLSDLSMADQLYHYMEGGQKRPPRGANKDWHKSPSYQIKEGDMVNVDVTSPGATLALGMMFFHTNNTAVAEWLAPPETQFLLDFVRPDFLMLRTISRCLVRWDSILPSGDWVISNLPAIVSKYAFNKDKYESDPDCDVDFETMSQAYCNLVAGACVAMALKFAGSANQCAFTALYDFSKKMLKLLSKPQQLEQAGKTTVEQCLIVIVLSLAMVMAGTGNLDVLRLCRHLRSRVGANYNYVLYGSHLGVSMALGLLFMGGGRYTLGTKPECVAILLCAIYPMWPIHSNDNRYHLQAFRHLYVLAAEPRILLPCDVATGQLCYIPLRISFKDTEDYRDVSYTDMAPCILPELNLLSQVEVTGSRYWPVHFSGHKNWNVLSQILQSKGYLYVKQRVGHLSYMADPQGYHSILAKSVTSDTSLGKLIKLEDVKSFSSDTRIVAFTKYFCSASNEHEYEKSQFLSRILYECISREKLDMLDMYLAMYQMQQQLPGNTSSLDLWQLKLVLAFYERLGKATKGATASKGSSDALLISDEFLTGIRCGVENTLTTWQNGPGSSILAKYLSGSNPVPATCNDRQMLSSFLNWYDAPQPMCEEDFKVLKDSQSVPVLYKKLCHTGLSVPAIMALSTVLQTTKPV
ncbi:Anaphase-promoting complex subunit 1 [Lamellibrachia satsuma]|nr:Anaphase-promoting complex subunit 1 [Lamellibrachia satsuma]